MKDSFLTDAFYCSINVSYRFVTHRTLSSMSTPISLYRPYCLTLHISNNRWRGEQSNETRTCYEHLLQRHRTNMRIAYMWLPGKTFDFVSQLPRHLSDALWSLNAKRSLTLFLKTRHIVVKKSKPYNTF